MSGSRVIEEKENLPLKQPKKRKVNRDNQAFSPKKMSKGTHNSSPEGLLHMRCNTATTVMDVENNVKPLRTSFTLKPSAIKINGVEPEKEVLNARVLHHLDLNMPTTFGKVSEVLERNENLSPIKLKIFSPTKDSLATHEVTRTMALGGLSLFDNRRLPTVRNNEVIRSVPQDHELFNSSPYKKMVKPAKSFKESKASLNQSSLNKTKKDNAKKGGIRTPSEKAILKESGNKFGKKLFGEEKEFEITHMIAHSMIGDDAQHEGNVFVATKEMNTQMILVETQKELLAKRCAQGFDVDTRVDLIEKEGGEKVEYLQVGTYLDYSISSANKFKISFQFNAQSEIKPNVDDEKIVRATLNGVMDLGFS